MNKRKTGTAYEEIAARYLTKEGICIVEKNYQIRQGEIDLIGLREDTLIFIEVKYRKNASYGYPWEAISSTKKRKICYAAKHYCYQKHWNKQIRFDVIGICGHKIYWFPNAFFYEGEL